MREMLNLSQDYKHGNFLEIQLRVFIVTLVIKKTIFNDRPGDSTNLGGRMGQAGDKGPEGQCLQASGTMLPHVRQSPQSFRFSVSSPARELTSGELQSSIFGSLCSKPGAPQGGSWSCSPTPSDVSALNYSARINIAGSQQYQVIGKGVLWPLG